MRTVTLDFGSIADRAGFKPGSDGRLNLPPTQDTAGRLCMSAQDMLGQWAPGDDAVAVTLTGAGPVWGYLCIAHALHGRVVRLDYSAPNASVTVFRHGV